MTTPAAHLLFWESNDDYDTAGQWLVNVHDSVSSATQAASTMMINDYDDHAPVTFGDPQHNGHEQVRCAETNWGTFTLRVTPIQSLSPAPPSAAPKRRAGLSSSDTVMVVEWRSEQISDIGDLREILRQYARTLTEPLCLNDIADLIGHADLEAHLEEAGVTHLTIHCAELDPQINSRQAL